MATYHVDTEDGHTYEVETEEPSVPQKGLIRRGTEAILNSPALPIAGSIAGGLAGGGVASIPLAGIGAAAGEAYRQLGKRSMGMDVPNTSLEAGKEMGIQGLGGAIGEGAGKLITAAAAPLVVPAARRSLGFASRFLKTAFSRAQATRAAEVAIEKDIIPVLGNPDIAYNRAVSLAKSAGNKIGQVTGKIDFSQIAPDAEFGLEKLRNVLTKGTKKGLFAGANETIDLVKSTILELYGKGATATEYNQAKNILGNSLNFLSDNSAQNINKRVVNSMATTIRKTVSKLLPDSYDEFIKNQRLFNAAELMKKALNDELGKQMGNNLPSLQTMAAGAANVASGNYKAAAASMGLSEALKRRGFGIGARALKGAIRNPNAVSAATKTTGLGLINALEDNQQ